MQKWEYRILYCEPTGPMNATVWDTGLPEERFNVPVTRGRGLFAAEASLWRGLSAHLNKLGEEGWEIASTDGRLYVLKRPKP